MSACVEFVSHADYTGEPLRKLGEWGAIGSELHLKSINLIMVRRKDWCRNRRGEESCQRCIAVSWASGLEGMNQHGSRRYGKGRTEVGDAA